MLLIPCPHCGPRPEIEFRYAGESHVARAADPGVVNDQDWAEYLYFRSNPKGMHFERWRHVSGCARFFNCVRDTVSDKILTTYPAGEKKSDLGTLMKEAGR
jgi:sarcosine oxidase subunit delta